jgi:hypothetical protein
VHLADEPIAEQMHRCGDRCRPSRASSSTWACTPGRRCAWRHRASPRRRWPSSAALWETLETESRQIFIGRVLMLHARDGLVDTETWRVRLQDYHPVARFGASFYIRTRERFAMSDGAARPETSTPIDEM